MIAVMKPVKYRIILSDIARLSGDVNAAMEDGWQPHGGAFTYSRADGSQGIGQAMLSTKKRSVQKVLRTVAAGENDD